jgi:hypothetical protein
LPFTLRLYFYAGSQQVRMVHTFIYDGEAEKDMIRSLGVQFDVPMREAAYNRHIAFATESGIWTEPVQPLDGRRTSLSITTEQEICRPNRWQERGFRMLMPSMPTTLLYSSTGPSGIATVCRS